MHRLHVLYLFYLYVAALARPCQQTGSGVCVLCQFMNVPLVGIRQDCGFHLVAFHSEHSDTFCTCHWGE